MVWDRRPGRQGSAVWGGTLGGKIVIKQPLRGVCGPVGACIWLATVLGWQGRDGVSSGGRGGQRHGEPEGVRLPVRDGRDGRDLHRFKCAGRAILRAEVGWICGK